MRAAVTGEKYAGWSETDVRACYGRRDMITRLEVDGFKSLQGFAVDLEPFTVFIGPNGAGKSNILSDGPGLKRCSQESSPTSCPRRSCSPPTHR